jgi:hypothetical protein
MSTSKYGREDDKKVNYKALAGQDLTMFVSKQKDLDKVARFFKEVKVEELKPLEGVVYYLVTGKSFDYSAYRQQILLPVYEQYYRAPEWLPEAECRFKQNYDF